MSLPDNPDLADLCADAVLEARRKGPLFRPELAQVIRETLAAHPEELKAPTVEQIYDAYPRKVGRAAAVLAIKRKISKTVTTGRLLERTKAFARAVAQWPESERHFCPHPATWFNQGRFDDDPKEWLRGTTQRPSGPATL